MDPIRVLILEDDDDIIDLLRSILEPVFECFTASNGLEGLQQAIRGQPDLVICDIMMPVMDGRDFMRRMREIPTLSNVPVIFLSALSSRDQIRNGYELGAALYMTKPIDPVRFKRNLELFVADHNIVALPKKRRIVELSPMSLPSRETPPEPKPGISTEPPAPAQSPERPLFDPRLVGMSKVDMKAPKLARPRILIVEDDNDTIQLIRNGLGEDFEVVEAGDGVSAIEQAVRYKPDLFIIDGMLPKMTGYQLATMLKKNREFYRSPIVFISGKATERDQQYVKRLGVPYFLAKPFTAGKILGIAREITSQPGFTIHQDRIALNQIYLEKFQHIETHRANRPAMTLDQLERRKAENQLRRQLQ